MMATGGSSESTPQERSLILDCYSWFFRPLQKHAE